MSEPRVIKRYANRKLYDTQHSCYVTLEQIAQMIREGEDVQILDNNTKEDLTSVTLAQIIFEEEKKRRLLPLVGLKSIIQSSGESIQDFVLQIRKDVDHTVGRVFQRRKDGEIVEVEPATGASVEAPEAEPAPESPKTAAAFKDFLDQSQKRLDEWQAQIDQQLRKAVENIHPLPRLQKEVHALIERLQAIEKRLESLEKK